MKPIVAVFLIGLLFTACRKDQLEAPCGPDYDSFLFGITYKNCDSNCARLFSIAHDQLFAAAPNNGKQGAIFQPNPLSNDKYLVAKQLTDNLPDYLLEHPNSTLGCPDCTGHGAFLIEIYTDDEKTYWNIDTNISNLPVEIRAYISQLQTVLSRL